MQPPLGRRPPMTRPLRLPNVFAVLSCSELSYEVYVVCIITSTCIQEVPFIGPRRFRAFSDVQDEARHKPPAAILPPRPCSATATTLDIVKGIHEWSQGDMIAARVRKKRHESDT